MKIREDEVEEDKSNAIIEYENFIQEKWNQLNNFLSPNQGGVLGTILWILSRLVMLIIAILLSPILIIGLLLALIAVA